MRGKLVKASPWLIGFALDAVAIAGCGGGGGRGGGVTTSGTVTTTSASPPGAGDLITLTGMQPFSSGGGIVQALIPFFSTNTVPKPSVVETTLDGTGTGGPDCSSLLLVCPVNTNCACYQLSVPASNPVVGAANSDGSGYAAPAASPVDFSVDATATAIGGSTPEC